MSVQNGRLTTCDRCGATVFSKCTGEGEADGGYTRWNKFEQLPHGWGQVTIPKKSSLSDPRDCRHVTVCPLCNAAWRTALEVYFCDDTLLDEGPQEPDDMEMEV